MGLLDSVLGASLDDPRTAAIMQLAGGMASGRGLLDGTARGGVVAAIATGWFTAEAFMHDAFVVGGIHALLFIAVLIGFGGFFIVHPNEAKALGIPMGAPFHEFKRLADHDKVEVFSSNYPLYGDMSARVMRT